MPPIETDRNETDRHEHRVENHWMNVLHRREHRYGMTMKTLLMGLPVPCTEAVDSAISNQRRATAEARCALLTQIHPLKRQSQTLLHR